MKYFLYLFSLFLILFHLTACSSHPLGMSDEEWTALTPQQKYEAREKQAEIDLEQRKLAIEREKRYNEQKRLERIREREQDVANGMIAEYYPDQYACFGGEKCPHRYNEDDINEIVIPLHALTNIDVIQIYADDRVGHKHDAIMGVSVDNYKVKSFDVSKRTKWHQVFVGRPARNIVLRAETDDEIRLYRVKVYGSRILNDQLKYKYNISD